MLQRIDAATCTEVVSPAPPPEPNGEFFGDGTSPEQVLVAEVEDVPVGYVKVGPRYRRLSSAAHVHQISGLAVAPESQGHGVGRRLVMAAVDAARSRGARRLTLNVLGTNHVARRLYARCGFVVEGVQPGQFYLGGRYVDDVLLALDLAQPQPIPLGSKQPESACSTPTEERAEAPASIETGADWGR
jgi:ribosomal protein S18 acetylase RimI-like enzyme